MENRRGSVIILNGTSVGASEFNPDASKGIYYEVIRLINGQFLFLDDHLERLKYSCSKAGLACPEKEEILQTLQLLVEKESIIDGNVKLVVFQQRERIHLGSFFVPHFFPSDVDYQTGVRVMTYAFERPDPTIKKWNENFRNNVGRFIREENIYEAILLNEAGELTEGSRSNLFFTDPGNRIITAPEGMILSGITRKYVLKICDGEGIKIIEKAVTKAEAATMKGCFISGTSPMVLPVRELDELEFDPRNMVLNRIMAAYKKMIHTTGEV
ncbi:MAG: aminotransferase class IV [Bacteroidales bacterium]